MKLNHFNSTSTVLHKSVEVALLIILSFQLQATAINLDSLKHVLKTSDNPQDNCPLLFELYKHYKTTEQVDSMNVYAKNCLKECILCKKEGFPVVSTVIYGQFRQGFVSNISPVADSLLTVIKDPDTKLRLLVNMAEANFYYNDKEEIDKYWSQAEIAIKNTKEDYSKYLYYNFSGYQNTVEGTIFTALQCYELAGTFVEENSVDYLKNNSDLANIYVLNYELEKAKDIYYNTLEKAKENNYFRRQCYIYYALMTCHTKLNEYDKVIELAHKSIQLAAESNLNVPNGYSYHMLGQSYLALSNADPETYYLDTTVYTHSNNINTTATYLDSTNHYLDKGIEYSIEHNHSKELADNYFTMSYYYGAIGNRDKAKYYLEKAQKEKSYADNSKIDIKLAELWAADKNYTKAYFHLNNYVNHTSQKEKDEKKDLALATKIIKDSYNYKEQSQANLSMAKEKEIRLRNIITLALFGLLLIASTLIYVQKNRKKLKTLNKRIDDRNKELDQRNKVISQRNKALNKSNKELDILINKQKETIKYLDNFASVAAHDLKVPIRTASSFAGLLTKTSYDKLNDKEKESLKFIGTSIAKLSGMIDDLLSLSRLDCDLPQEREINLMEIVLGAEALLSSLLSKTESKILVETTLPKILGHSTLISQLFQNIIKNAIVHNKTGNNTIIKINAEFIKDNMHTIKISDNSGGIPEYMIPTMFDLFSSGNKNTGNGIGLATCKKIVNHYGGDIWVDVDPGVGSTFNFNLFS